MLTPLTGNGDDKPYHRSVFVKWPLLKGRSCSMRFAHALEFLLLSLGCSCSDFCSV